MKWNVVENVGAQWDQMWRKSKTAGKEVIAENRIWQTVVAKKWSLLLLIMAFLLGRATILDELSPFAAAFFAAVYILRRDLAGWTGLLVFAGSVLSMQMQAGIIIGEMLVFVLIHRAMERFERSELSSVPIIVFASAFLVKLFYFTVQNELGAYTVLMAGVESLLSLVLTMIFLQAIPVFTLTRKNYNLKNEEIICLIILLASVMTGTVGWMVSGASVEHIMSRYFILLFAFVGGAPLGASVGVVTGLILSLASVESIYQISLLAFAGMLAGLLNQGGKVAVGLGLLIGSSILSVYVGEAGAVLQSLLESSIAVIMFLMTPKSFIQVVAKYVPGTAENVKSYHDYARRVRDITAGRVEQFSEVFRQLSKSFILVAPEASGQVQHREEEVGHFMNAVAGKACAGCWKQRQCWDEKFYRTYTYMTDMMTSIEMEPEFSKKQLKNEWKQSCVKTDLVLDVMKQQYEQYQYDQHWKKQISESRRLVAEQLSGVSQVMEDLAREIKREGHELFLQEEQIRHALEDLGLSIYSIDIVSLDEGNVEIEIIHQYNKGLDECRKIIAPLLSDILGENIAVKHEKNGVPSDGFSTVMFGSAKEYSIETGIASAAKNGELLSGDSYSMVELGNGKFAVAVSDGMGNGERARAESSAALSILQQLLQSGMDEKLAIKSVNSVLLLRSSDEVYATVDVAIIDLYNANTTFMKIGSTPSFIKRGNQVIPITGNNLPVGILREIDVDLISQQLEPGDILIMMTDGIYDAPGHAVNKELWMKRIIQEMHTDDPQDIADCLLETVFRHHEGEIYDDMTVLVAKVEKFKPEWAAFRWHGMHNIERPRTVS